MVELRVIQASHSVLYMLVLSDIWQVAIAVDAVESRLWSI